MKKRLLATVLCLALLLTLLPSTALSAGEGAIQLGMDGVKVRDRVYFGRYETLNFRSYDVPWVALKKGADGMMLLSVYLLGEEAFAQGNGYYPGEWLQKYVWDTILISRRLVYPTCLIKGK